MDNYQAPPADLRGTTSPSLCTSPSNEGTIVKKFAKILLTTMALTMSMPSTANQNETSRSSYVKALASSQSISAWEKITTKQLPKLEYKEPIAKKSSRLQSSFGFKTAQWAAVLKLERKTLYNWKKNPNTAVQKRTQDRIDIFEAFADEIDEEHHRYISKISFGRYSESAFRDVLVSTNLNYEALVAQYDRLYTKLDGQYKRDKHRKGLV